MNAIPETGFLRIGQILGDAKRGTPPLIPLCPSTWWDGVKTGKYPKPIKLSGRVTAWRAEDIRRFMETGYVEQEETK